MPMPRVNNMGVMVRDGPKLLDDGGEIPKFQGRGWQFEFPAVISPLYLTKHLPCGQPPPMLWRWHVNLLSQNNKNNNMGVAYVGFVCPPSTTCT